MGKNNIVGNRRVLGKREWIGRNRRGDYTRASKFHTRPTARWGNFGNNQSTSSPTDVDIRVDTRKNHMNRRAYKDAALDLMHVYGIEEQHAYQVLRQLGNHWGIERGPQIAWRVMARTRGDGDIDDVVATVNESETPLDGINSYLSAMHHSSPPENLRNNVPITPEYVQPVHESASPM